MCNGYYIIITAHLRQAFFEDFFILLKNTRYCTFSVFLSSIPHIHFIELLFFYHFHRLSKQYFPIKFQFAVTLGKTETTNIEDRLSLTADFGHWSKSRIQC